MSFSVKEPTLRDIAWEGKGEIKFLVDGLHSYSNPATFELVIERDTQRIGGWDSTDYNTYWSYKVTSLGYGVKPDEGRTDGYANYAIALQEVSNKINQYSQLEDKMEEIFQQGEAHRKAEAEAERQRIKEQREADAPVGMKLAKRVIAEMRRQAKEELGTWQSIGIKAVTRGTRQEREINVTFSRAGLILFSEGYSRTSKASALALIADSWIDGLEITGIGLPDPKVANFFLSKSKK
jgi:thiamine phosphate synthase YjbQ (UPF0047 family)